jgi:predicted nucleotidyltransferase
MDILAKLQKVKDELKQEFGIEEFALFGSYARGEEKEDSDIDIAILKMEKKSFFKRLKAKEFLEKYLSKKVDIGYFDSIRPIIKKRIKQDMIYV